MDVVVYTVAMIVVIVFFLFLLAVFRGDALPPASPAVLLVAAGSLVLGLGAGVLFIHAVQHVRSPIASTITYVEPVTAAAVGALAFGERLGSLVVVGAAVVVGAGVWVALEPAPARTAVADPEQRAA